MEAIVTGTTAEYLADFLIFTFTVTGFSGYVSRRASGLLP